MSFLQGCNRSFCHIWLQWKLAKRWEVKTFKMTFQNLGVDSTIWKNSEDKYSKIQRRSFTASKLTVTFNPHDLGILYFEFLDTLTNTFHWYYLLFNNIWKLVHTYRIIWDQVVENISIICIFQKYIQSSDENWREKMNATENNSDDL